MLLVGREVPWLWEVVGRSLKYDPVILLLGVHPRAVKTYICTNTNGCSHVILGSQEVEAVPMSISSDVPQLVDGQDVVHPDNGLLIGNKEQGAGACCRVLCDSICAKCLG